MSQPIGVCFLEVLQFDWTYINLHCTPFKKIYGNLYNNKQEWGKRRLTWKRWTIAKQSASFFLAYVVHFCVHNLFNSASGTIRKGSIGIHNTLIGVNGIFTMKILSLKTRLNGIINFLNPFSPVLFLDCSKNRKHSYQFLKCIGPTPFI